MLTCIRRLEWDAMHRIPAHEHKCSAWHGHRYAVEIHCTAPELDHCGRVVDFGVIKREVGGWIDEHWDHTALIMKGDPDPAVSAIAESNAAWTAAPRSESWRARSAVTSTATEASASHPWRARISASSTAKSN